MSKTLDMKTVTEVCKIGQGSLCCRYLIVGSQGFECSKSDPKMKSVIDGKLGTMTAQGDNCEGK